MKKLIELALSMGHIVTIEREDEWTRINIKTKAGYFKRTGMDFLNCSYFPEDEMDECNECIDDLKLGLYQYS